MTLLTLAFSYDFDKFCLMILLTPLATIFETILFILAPYDFCSNWPLTLFLLILAFYLWCG